MARVTDLNHSCDIYRRKMYQCLIYSSVTQLTLTFLPPFMTRYQRNIPRKSENPGILESLEMLNF